MTDPSHSTEETPEDRAQLDSANAVLQRALATGEPFEILYPLLELWTGSYFPDRYYDRETWLKMFRLASPQMVTDRGLGDPLTVYRGSLRGAERGMSWTTHREVARWFADRWLQEIAPDTDVAYVYEARIPLSAVVCDVEWNVYSGRHGEREIIVDPSSLGDIREIETVERDHHSD